MVSTIFSGLGGLTGSSISMVILLAKATLILLVALGITLSMQRASAGVARAGAHCVGSNPNQGSSG